MNIEEAARTTAATRFVEAIQILYEHPGFFLQRLINVKRHGTTVQDDLSLILQYWERLALPYDKSVRMTIPGKSPGYAHLRIRALRQDDYIASLLPQSHELDAASLICLAGLINCTSDDGYQHTRTIP